jgi:Chaperone of endosialidase
MKIQTGHQAKGAASEGLFALKPVNFRYKPDFDPDQSERFGLIAEDAEKVIPLSWRAMTKVI